MRWEVGGRTRRIPVSADYSNPRTDSAHTHVAEDAPYVPSPIGAS